MARLRHAVLAQGLALALLCAALSWSPGGLPQALAGLQGRPGREEAVEVAIPPSARAGDMLKVSLAGRRTREVEVPAGASAGEVLRFDVPERAYADPTALARWCTPDTPRGTPCRPNCAPRCANHPPQHRHKAAGQHVSKAAIEATVASDLSKLAVSHGEMERLVTAATRQAYRKAVANLKSLSAQQEGAAVKLQGGSEAAVPSFKGEIWSLRSEDGSYPFGKPEMLPDFSGLGSPQATIESEVIDLNDEAWQKIGWHDNFAARWTGQLVVRAGGTYKFFTESDDGSKLYINGELVVDNDGLHAPLTKEGTIDLEAGEYEIKVLFFEHQGSADIRVKYAGPDTGAETKLLKAQSVGADVPPSENPEKPSEGQASDTNGESDAASGAANGDDFGPLIDAIKDIIKASSSKDADATAAAQDKLKGAVEGIVQAKLKAEKKKEAAKRVARERAEKREEEEAFSKKLGRLLGEQKAVEEAKVKAAQKAQKEAEDRAAAERSRSKASSSSPVGAAAELEKDKAVVESASKTVSSEAKSAEGDAKAAETADEEAESAAKKALQARDEAEDIAGKEAADAKQHLSDDEQAAADALEKANRVVDAASETVSSEAKSAEEDAKAAGTADEEAESAAKRALQARDEAEDIAGKEAADAKQHLSEDEQAAADALEKENEVVEAARDAYSKAAAEAASAEVAEKTTDNDVEEMREAEERITAEADGAFVKAEAERDAAEKERFDAEEAATKSKVEESKAEEERKRAEKAAKEAEYTGVSNADTVTRMEDAMDEFRDDFKDEEEHEIAEDERRLNDVIKEGKQETSKAVREAVRRVSKRWSRQVHGVRRVVRDLTRELESRVTRPSRSRYPRSADSWGAAYATPAFMAGGYPGGAWEDRAIFLQRELNDIQAERGLYANRLAGAVDNMARKVVAAPHVALPSFYDNPFGWFQGAARPAMAVLPSPQAATVAATLLPHYVSTTAVTSGGSTPTNVEQAVPALPAIPAVQALPAGVRAMGGNNLHLTAAGYVPSSGGMMSEDPLQDSISHQNPLLGTSVDQAPGMAVGGPPLTFQLAESRAKEEQRRKLAEMQRSMLAAEEESKRAQQREAAAQARSMQAMLQQAMSDAQQARGAMEVPPPQSEHSPLTVKQKEAKRPAQQGTGLFAGSPPAQTQSMMLPVETYTVDV